MDKDKIKELKDYYVNTFYAEVRKEQAEDDTFHKDTFKVPQIKDPVDISRTGGGAELIDMPVHQIAAMQIQAFRKPLKDTKAAQDSADKVSELLNEVWLPTLLRINPNPREEFLKNLFLRGEAWQHPVHNQSWVLSPFTRKGLPVLYLTPDPMNIYASPNEDENGIPEHVIVWYQRMPWIIKSKYPAFENPKHAGEKDQKRTVDWLEYWDGKQRFFEADGQTIVDSPNPYPWPPFVHKLSGLGKSSPEGKMEDLIVGRLRRERDLLRRECAITSDMDWVFHNFANRSIDVQPVDDAHSIPEDFEESYRIGTGLVHILPAGITVTRAVDELPGAEELNYLYGVRADVGRKTPLALTGAAVGQTGRLQDIVRETAMKRFGAQVRAEAHAWETSLGMGLWMIENIPKLMPDGINKSDINKSYEVKIELKADDPIEADRKAMLGSRLYQQGEIDLMTNLTKYQGYTQEEAKRIYTNILVDGVTIKSPEIAALMGLIAADDMGMSEELRVLRAMRQQAEGITPTPSPTEQKRRAGEEKTPTGLEMLDSTIGGQGVQSPPEAYTRT